MGKFKRKTKEEREEEIRNAAIKVFKEKGYRNTTMEDIIAETTLSKGGVYRYFVSPKEILISLMEQGNENVFEILMMKDLENVSYEELPALLAEKTIKKIYDYRPLKEVYIIFLNESMYDPNFVKAHEEIEKKNIEKISAIIKKRFPELTMDEDRMALTTKFIMGLLYFNTFFTGNEKAEKEILYDMFCDFYKKMLKY